MKMNSTDIIKKEEYLEPSTIRQLLDLDESKEVQKLLAAKVIQNTEAPFIDFYVFENVVYLLNNIEPNIKQVEGASPEMIWLALESIKNLRPDFKLSHEVKMYIRFSFKNEGLIFLPPLTQMENPNLKEVQQRANEIKKGKDPLLDDTMDVQALKFLRIKEYINNGNS